MTLGKIRTTKEIEDIVGEFGYKLLKHYYIKEKRRKMVIIQDNNGYKYDIELSSLVANNGKAHIVGTNNPFSLDNIEIWLIINKMNYKLCDENTFLGSQKELFCYCFECKNKFKTRWDFIKRKGTCAVCVGKQVGENNNLGKLHPRFINEWLYSENNLTPFLVTAKCSENVYWKCSICSYKWWAKVSIRTNERNVHNCPSCSGRVVSDKNRLSILYPDIAKEFHPNKNGNLNSNDISYGSDKKIWWLCNKCDHEWKTSVTIRTCKNSGCPRCNESKGESKISEFLLKNNIVFIPQHTFNNCKNKRKLPFDFHLLDYNILIEYDGEFHTQTGRWKNREKAIQKLENTKRNDEIKNQYCKDNDISLLRINYTDFDNIENILINYLKL